MSKIVEMDPLEVMVLYRNGDETYWHEEFTHLLLNDGPKLAELLVDMETNGQKEPIILGNDGRVWDGHHRLLVARLLDINIKAELVK